MLGKREQFLVQQINNKLQAQISDLLSLSQAVRKYNQYNHSIVTVFRETR